MYANSLSNCIEIRKEKTGSNMTKINLILLKCQYFSNREANVSSFTVSAYNDGCYVHIAVEAVISEKQVSFPC